jgi:predicted nucleic acid-binding protein
VIAGDVVVDASVAMKLFFEEDLSSAADQLFARAAGPDRPRLFAPELFYAQCANVFWKRVRRGDAAAGDVRTRLMDLLALPIESISTASLASRALDIALEFNVSAYDGCYVAAASGLEIPLVTADERLVGLFRKTSNDVRLLGSD